MDIEFHYYVNLIIAKMAGYDDITSEIIAYSAQFVDDNTEQILVLMDNCNTSFVNIITQSMNIMKMVKEDLKDIYTCFHFQPGAASRNKFWITKAKSSLAKVIFNEALLTKNPYMIGIASHAYADTYAHQNFRGDSHVYNNPIGLRNLPNYGHMYYGELPDLIGIKWLDVRTDKIIDNNKRFVKCAIDLLTHYCWHNVVTLEECENRKIILKKFLKKVFGKAKFYIPGLNNKYLQRIKYYSKEYQKLGGRNFNCYENSKWVDQAIYRCSLKKNWIAMHDYENSHWYNFQSQVKNYKLLVMEKIQFYWDLCE